MLSFHVDNTFTTSSYLIITISLFCIFIIIKCNSNYTVFFCKLNIIPGSYDLSGDGSGSVFVSAEIYESLLENETYLNQYNEYLERLEAEYGSIA